MKGAAGGAAPFLRKVFGLRQSERYFLHSWWWIRLNLLLGSTIMIGGT